MEFTFNYDNHEFIADKNKVDSIINKLNLYYKYSNREIASLSMLIIDSNELEEYVLDKITHLEDPFKIYDLEKNKSLNLEELNNLIKSRRQICIKGFDQYISFLNQSKAFTINPKNILYSNLTIARDSFFVKYKTKVLFILSSKEHQDFIKYGAGQNLFSYCGFLRSTNEIFKLKNSNITLDEYLNNQRINFSPNNENITIKEIEENQTDEAFNLCFEEFIKYTIFSKFESIDKESKQLNLTISKNYHKQYNTKIFGAYHNTNLIGVLEINNNYINQIAVSDNYKHKGIGYKLFLESIKDKDEGTEIYMDADKNTIETYKKWGFDFVENEEKSSKMIYIIQKEKDDKNNFKRYRK